MKSSELITTLIEKNRDYFFSNRVSGTGKCPEEPQIFVNTSEGLFLVSSISVDPTIGLIVELS